MENDEEAKHLAAEFITQCRGQGRSIETIANAAGWILQIIAHLEFPTQKSHCASNQFGRSTVACSPFALAQADVKQRRTDLSSG